MTGRQRVLKAIEHEKPDRTPCDIWMREDVVQRLLHYLSLNSVEELYKFLEIDMRKIKIDQYHPWFEEAGLTELGGNSPASGGRFIIYPDGRFEDPWKIVRKQGSDGLYDQWVSGPFVDTKDLDTFNWPELTIFDDVSVIRQRVEEYNYQYAISAEVNLPFKVAWHMRGLENFLCDMILDPPFCRELLERLAVYEVEKGLRLIKGGVDILGIIGDIAMQDRLMMQPDTWRSLEKPILYEMINKFRQENPKIKIFFHSDGDLSSVIPDLIEIGVDILNPIQPECMDPVWVKRTYGDKLTLYGTISLQRTLPYGTVDDVRAELAGRIKYCGEDGGLIICPSNLLQNDIPLENILALYAK